MEISTSEEAKGLCKHVALRPGYMHARSNKYLAAQKLSNRPTALAGSLKGYFSKIIKKTFSFFYAGQSIDTHGYWKGVIF